MRYHTMAAFARLEEHYGLVYWDQRSSGPFSEGSPDPSTYTVAQYCEDMHLVLLFVQRQYPGARLVLLGHSWGATLAYAYLASAYDDVPIAGLICSDGTQDLAAGIKTSRDLVVGMIEAGLAEGTFPEDERNDWREILTRYAGLGSTIPADAVQVNWHFRNVDALGGYYRGVAPRPYLHFNQLVNPDVVREGLASEIYAPGSGFSADAPDILVPTLLLWGRYDYVLPLCVGEADLARIGSAHKSMVVFQDSAHSPMEEEPELFADSIIGFLGANW